MNQRKLSFIAAIFFWIVSVVLVFISRDSFNIGMVVIGGLLGVANMHFLNYLGFFKETKENVRVEGA